MTSPLSEQPNPDLELVLVYKTDDPGLFPLVKLALEEAGIEYLVRRPGTSIPEVYRPVTHELTGDSEPAEVFVTEDDAARAREVLADLANRPAGGVAPAAQAPPAGHRSPLEPLTVNLHDLERGVPLGQISESELECLSDLLEEDASTEQSYYIDAPTVEMLADNGADANLVELLRRVISGRDGVQIQWSRASS
jgi:Putative prokaryotic signal transducing protein